MYVWKYVCMYVCTDNAGGSSCTLVAVVGSRVYVANVGDSSALLCSSHPCMSSHANLTYLIDGAVVQGSDASSPSSIQQPVNYTSSNNTSSNYMDDGSSSGSSSSSSGGSKSIMDHVVRKISSNSLSK